VPVTESTDPTTRDLDTLATRDLVAAFSRHGVAAAEAVARVDADVARAVDAIVPRLRAGGTLHYVGAGTSGRLAMLDAAECPPTFGTPPSLVVAHVAGGIAALVRAIEGAEDDADAGAEVARTSVRAGDAVVGISASGGAPFVVAAMRTARETGAVTIALTSVAGSAAVAVADIAIVVETGAEPLSGSTRLGAGTAAKLVLSAISTAAMVRLGRVYDNLMVDVVATNAKLHARAERLVRTIANVEPERARARLAAAAGSVKVAIAMQARGVGAEEARALLVASGGFLRPVIKAGPR
jgi:N-acetylmuramic acid 6-phosphate etherase